MRDVGNPCIFALRRSRNEAQALFGGMEVSEAKRLRELEAENLKLKKLLAESELDKAALKEIVEGKW